MDREEAIIRLEQILDFTNIPKTQMALQMAIDDMREQEEQKWIPVTERLPKPITNADRIRSMTDEELAKVLNAFTAYFVECNRSADEVDCKDCELNDLCSLNEGKAIEWLQQPVKEE